MIKIINKAINILSEQEKTAVGMEDKNKLYYGTWSVLSALNIVV